MQINYLDWITQLVEDVFVNRTLKKRHSVLLDVHIVEIVKNAAGIQKLDVNWLIINMSKKSIIQQVLSGEDKPIELGIVS